MNFTRRVLSFVLAGGFCLFFSLKPAKAACDLSIAPNDISLVPSTMILEKAARIYASVEPNCEEDVEGLFRFYENGEFLGQAGFSYKGNGLAEEVWIAWMPKAYGERTIRVETFGGSQDASGSASLGVFVDRDTDGDGVPDAQDKDDDNDGVLDAEDQFPLDPGMSKDTDGDGIDDKTDSDDDNDGLYDFEEEASGTDSIKRDTDGDRVGDKEDAFPLDVSKSEHETVSEPASVELATNEEQDAQEGNAPDVVYEEAEGVEEVAVEEPVEQATSTPEIPEVIESVSSNEPRLEEEKREPQEEKSAFAHALWALPVFTGLLAGAFLTVDRVQARSRRRR